MYNTVPSRSLNLLHAAISSSSKLLRDVFIESSKLAFCFVGYNYLFGARHWKYYAEQDCLLANFLREILTYNSSTNRELREEIIPLCLCIILRRIILCLLCLYDTLFQCSILSVWIWEPVTLLLSPFPVYFIVLI